MNGDEMSFKTS